MNTKDSFHDTLISQYRELIKEAILESEVEHKTNLDLNILTHSFQLIKQEAILDGISENEVHELVTEAMRFHKISLKVG
jgi:hypothetical protein